VVLQGEARRGPGLEHQQATARRRLEQSAHGYLVEAGKLERIRSTRHAAGEQQDEAAADRAPRGRDPVREHVPDGPHRAAAAFQEGAGVEMQAMLNTRRRDIVDETNRVMWAHGEKNDSAIAR
jgi:hypothetical protein